MANTALSTCQNNYSLVGYHNTVNEETKGNNDTAEGVVTEALPNALFRVELSSGEEVISYLAGKMRIHRIKVLVGDTVQVKLDPYGGRGRIVRRS